MKYRYRYNKQLSDYSRTNRRVQTDTEKLLWHHLRARQLAGFKFRRQYPVRNYILDFYCIEKKLAVELDGSQHILNEDYDRNRENALRSNGITVLRFWDNDVLQNMDGVLTRISEYLTKKTSSLPAGRQANLLLKGEGTNKEKNLKNQLSTCVNLS